MKKLYPLSVSSVMGSALLVGLLTATTPAQAGGHEWATAGKILTGVVLADLLLNHVVAEPVMGTRVVAEPVYVSAPPVAARGYTYAQPVVVQSVCVPPPPYRVVYYAPPPVVYRPVPTVWCGGVVYQSVPPPRWHRGPEGGRRDYDHGRQFGGRR